MSENETKKIYITKEEYEADTNYSSRKIHREKFKDVETKAEMTPEQEKKATWKYLFLCNPDRYALKSVLEELNNIRSDENRVISHQYSQIKVMVIPTNEEVMIARDTVRLLEL